LRPLLAQISDLMTGKFGAYVELATAMVFVGTSVIVGKLVVSSFPIFLANALRLAVGLTLLAIVTAKNRAELRTLRRTESKTLSVGTLVHPEQSAPQESGS
jgi:hypothetical protein